jgi:proteasome lid subunit RPN8/RPN11
MSRKAKAQGLGALRIDAEVVRQIRLHARSENKTEVCGVLLGRESGDSVEISTRIPGVNAAQGGAHVTFTQDTWEHIYKVKDKEHPDERILGWYHSHPGFGIFLSEHDTFIHQNFFSSPRQVAWVYDPVSDEEGCFGWQRGQIVRLAQVEVVDRRGGEAADKVSSPAAVMVDEEVNEPVAAARRSKMAFRETADERSLQNLVTAVLSYLSVLFLGFAISYFLFPRLVVMAIPVSAETGRPVGLPVELPPREAQEVLRLSSPAIEIGKQPEAPGKAPEPESSPPKDGNVEHR